MFKYIIVIFLFFCRSLYAQEELFTCTDIDSGGFYYNGSEYQLTLFNLGQFDMKIDFENNSNVLNITHVNSDKELLINTLNLISKNYKEYSKKDQIQNILNTVKKEIGAHAKPDKIQFAPSLPKTRSGKIMRRILRKIAENDLENLGDISTLADPSVVEELIHNKI